MNDNGTRFIRLTKANKDKDRLLVAIDSICSVEESVADKCTNVYTIDGFWYSVLDPIEKFDENLCRNHHQGNPNKKIKTFRGKKVQSAAIEQVRHNHKGTERKEYEINGQAD